MAIFRHLQVVEQEKYHKNITEDLWKFDAKIRKDDNSALSIFQITDKALGFCYALSEERRCCFLEIREIVGISPALSSLKKFLKLLENIAFSPVLCYYRNKGGLTMDLYKELAALRCFTHGDMVRLAGSESAAQWQIKNYLKKGYIERVRRDLYAVISMETDQPIPNRFQIVSKISDDAYVSHHSAFEYYGYSNQVFYGVYFGTAKRVRPFEYDGLNYQPVVWRGDVGIEKTGDGVRITSLERTVIDSIADFTRIGGMEELLRCISLVPSFDEKKLIEALEIYNRGQLYQKVGYILESFRDELVLSDEFFEKCVIHSSASKTYLFEKQNDFVFHEKWMLYAPKQLKMIIDKGVNDYDAV